MSRCSNVATLVPSGAGRKCLFLHDLRYISALLRFGKTELHLSGEMQSRKLFFNQITNRRGFDREKIGDVVEVKVPAGIQNFKIEEIQ